MNEEKVQMLLNERVMLITQQENAKQLAEDDIIKTHYRPEIRSFTGLLDDKQQPVQEIQRVTIDEFIKFLDERLEENQNAINSELLQGV